MSSAQRARLRHGSNPKRWTTVLHVPGRDNDVFKLITLSAVTEFFTAKTMLQYLNSLIHQRYPTANGESKATELVRRVSHTKTNFDPAARKVIKHSKVFSQAKWMIEWRQANVSPKPNVTGDRRHGASHRNPAGQIAIINKVMFRKPHQISPNLVKPLYLLQYFAI